MADALLSPAVGAAFWGLSTAALGRATRRVRATDADERVALMGVTGAFVFAAQMINFPIPGTGASGHLGGALLLALLLGPHAALLVLAAVLAVQALLFADGGLLAYGANLFNLGVLPCLLVYPALARVLDSSTGAARWGTRPAIAVVLAAAVAALLGAAGIVVQTTASGIAALPPAPFLALMLPIHLAIGVVEGVLTVAIVRAVARVEPALLAHLHAPVHHAPRRAQRALLAGAVLMAGGLSWLASDRPDGLEWSVARAATETQAAHRASLVAQAPARSDTPRVAAAAQTELAPLPDRVPPPATPAARAAASVQASPAFAGLAGGAVTLLLVGTLAWWLRRRR